METKEYSVGLDIGTTKIVAIVGRKNAHGKIEVMGVGKSKSLGVRKGIVHNMALTIESIKAAVEQAEKSAKVPIKKVTVGIAGKHIRSLQRTDSIDREAPESYITEEDIDLLKEKVNRMVMQPGEEIIHILPQEYTIDSEEEIMEPVGMHGARLEAKFHIVVGQVASIKNVVRCVKEAGLEMEALTLEPLASADAVLSQEEKEAGVAIVDIGGGTTDLAIFKDNIIRHTCVIPHGGGIITDDIKEACSIIEKYAEKLKVEYGSAISETEDANVVVSIPKLNGQSNKEISLKSLAQIIEARVGEILEFVNGELRRYYGSDERKRKLIAGVVLTGGGSNLKNIRQLASAKIGFDCRIGYANEYIVNDKEQILKNPEFSTSIGLLMEGLRLKERKEKEETEVETPTPVVATKEPNEQPASTTQPKENVETKKEKKKEKSFLEKIRDFFNDTE